ncbi:unnamed protein product [Allacma fusca]|uniref:Uncharacterized protein n=1 Tax=Allacma fusca TaxID=39272 RepID=A0A8J2P3M4_9HEXA|nr:unnamed protein product [Allacma fusca]
MSSSQNVRARNTRPEQTGLQKTIVVLLYPFEFLYVLLFILYIWCRDAVLCIVPRTPESLENEIILVTGGAQGIGREICREITRLEKNLTVITWDVDEKNNLETVDILKGQGVRNAFAFTVDVGDSEQVAVSAKKIRDTIANVDLSLKRYFFLNREMSPQFVASKIVDGMRHRKAHIYVPRFMRIFHFLLDVFPEEAFNKLMDFAGMPGIEDL